MSRAPSFGPSQSEIGIASDGRLDAYRLGENGFEFQRVVVADDFYYHRNPGVCSGLARTFGGERLLVVYDEGHFFAATNQIIVPFDSGPVQVSTRLIFGRRIILRSVHRTQTLSEWRSPMRLFVDAFADPQDLSAVDVWFNLAGLLRSEYPALDAAYLLDRQLGLHTAMSSGA